MQITAHGSFGYQGGGAQFATNFTAALERKGVEVIRHTFGRDARVPTEGTHLFFVGVQEFAAVMEQSRGIRGKKIGFVAWESTRYPQSFIDNLCHLDQLWVPSQWQRNCTIEQLKEADVSIPIDYADFVRVVPEGVDPGIFHPGSFPVLGHADPRRFRFLIFGRWEDRKCTREMIKNWMEAFPPSYSDHELLISADNAFPVDQYTTTEERLKAYGFDDPRITVVHHPPLEEYVRYLQEGHVLLNVSRGEGWGLPIIEGMACGIPVVCHDWSGNTEFCRDACHVPLDKLIKPFNVYGVPDCPGEWGEPNWSSYRWWLRELTANYPYYRQAALAAAVPIITNFSWDMAAERALELLRPLEDPNLYVPQPGDVILPEHGVAEDVRIVNPDWSCKIDLPNDGNPDLFEKHFAPAAMGGLVDRDRCKVLYTSLLQALKVPGEVWECGVYRGHTAAMLANVCADSGRVLDLFDSFEGLPEPGPLDHHRKGEFAATVEEARKLIGHDDIVYYHKGWFPAVFHEAPDGLIAFAHIDVDLYQSTLDCCRHIWPRMAVGGIMVFDDYGFPTTQGARKAIDDYFAEKRVQLVVLPTKQAMVTKEAAPAANVTPPGDKDTELVAAAFHAGYEIDRTGRGDPKLRKKEKSIFVITGNPDSAERLVTLQETITQVHAMAYKALIASPYAIPPTIFDKADHYLYAKDSPSIMRDVIRFCEGAWDRVHFLAYDVEVDLEEFLCKVAMAEKPVCISTRCPDLMSGGIMALADIYELDNPNWKDHEDKICHMDIVGDHRFQSGDPKTWPADTFDIHFVDGPYLKINGLSPRQYRVVFGTPDDPDEYELIQKPGMWARAKKKYFRDWTVRAELDGKEIFRHHLDLKGKRVMISIASKALGDTLAWIPYVLEFQKKHECHVICSCWWREILDYPELEIVAPGTGLDHLYASYEVGCFDNDPDRNVENWRVTPLQKVAADILGLDYVPRRARLKKFDGPRPAGKYVCLSEFSTMQPKLWNRPGAWQEIVDYCISLGYEVVSISKEPTTLKNVKKFNKRKIEDTCAVLSGAAFYIGLGHGPSWLAWSLGIPVVLISGFSEPWEEFQTYSRVINTNVCHGCFNDTNVPFDRGWDWCARKEWEGRPVVQYECTKEITPDMVKDAIRALL